MSAPASTQAIARSMALSMPSTANASVRAMMTNCRIGARIDGRLDPVHHFLLARRFPCRAGGRNAWTAPDLRCAARPAPNLMNDFTVRAMLNAPPHPVSASTSSGSGQASVMRRMSISTSSMVLMPEIRNPQGIGGDSAARQIQRLESAGRRHSRGIGVDGADDLQGSLGGHGGAQTRARRKRRCGRHTRPATGISAPVTARACVGHQKRDDLGGLDRTSPSA